MKWRWPVYVGPIARYTNDNKVLVLNVMGGTIMKQYIVPALPTERAQYERCYQLGLESLVATERQLRIQQSQCAGEPVSWFPQFTVRCQAFHADQRLDEVRQVLSELQIKPTSITVTSAWVELTFELALGLEGQPVWQATDGGLCRLYDGLLNNFIQTNVQPLTQIRVGLSDFEAAPDVTPQLIRPNFKQYSAATSRLTVMALPEAVVNEPGQHTVRKLYQLK
ncbi:hypothetical protein [Lactiplantibacillus paraxiangfangensis]|uniref:hypothetical protein n=2 Tax=Lactiplantibacillus paraxiangfangensis TaxID=3076224 RepID=UPI0030C73112